MPRIPVTTASVSEQLVEWLRGILKGHLCGAPDGQMREVRVFEQGHPPLTGTDPEAEAERETVPYAITHVVDGQLASLHETAQTLDVIILLSTYRDFDAKDDPAAGQKELWGLKDKILTAIVRNPFIGSAEAIAPIDWTTDDGGNAPFYFGALSFKLETRAALTEESEFA